MSYSSTVKREICTIKNETIEENIAELSAIMKVSGTITFSGSNKINFKVSTENPAIARRVFRLLKESFNCHSKILVKRSNSLKKNNLYIVLINDDMNVKDILNKACVFDKEKGYFAIDYDISTEIIKNEKCKRAYIRGAFLGGGSLSNPEKSYHLEFVTHDEEYGEKLSSLINSYNINSKVIKRKSSYVIYIKEGEQLVDFLNIVGAYNSLLEFENIRIIKEMRNNVNRIVNCETANLSKTVNASVRQVESIKLIKKEIGFNRLPKNLRDIAEVRINYPDETLKALGELLTPKVGKSGVNHRLRKIEKIAEELRREGTI
ncbi:MAG: DNA-binding protein WhiA [Clostridiaceae bacterium]